MDIAYESRIRERAYAFWLAAGMNDGDADRHWLRAEQDVRDETETPGAVTVAIPLGRRPAAAKKTASRGSDIKAKGTKPAKPKTAETKPAVSGTAAPRRPKSVRVEEATA